MKLRFIQRKGERTWFIDYRQDGQRQRKRLIGIHDRKTAEIAFADFKVRHARGQAGLATQENLAIRACLESYLEVKRGDCVKRHVASLEDGEAIILDHFGADTPVMSLTAKLVVSFKKALRERGNSPATINKRLGMLRAAIRKAVEDRKISRDPLIGVEKVSDPRPPAWRWLAHDEINRLLDISKNGTRVTIENQEKRKNKGTKPLRKQKDYERKIAPPKGLYPLVLFLLNTGARRGEALNMTWEDVDAGRGLVRLVATKKAVRGRSAKARFIPMNATLRELFACMSRGARNVRVFQISLNNLRRKFDRTCELAGLGHIRIHDLRHTFASHLAINGTPLNTIRELMGHETMTMTLRYAHLCPSVTAAAVEGLNLGGAKESARILSVGEMAG